MCGRFTLKTPVERLSEQFQFPKIIPLKPRYNIAPSQDVVVVRRMPDDRERKLAMLRWGLIPRWVKDPPGDRIQSTPRPRLRLRSRCFVTLSDVADA